MAGIMTVELVVAAIILLLLLLYKYLTLDYSYWKKRNVPYLEPVFPFGNIKDLVTNKADVGSCFKVMYNEMSGERFFGILELGQPALVLRDQELIKAVMIADFQNFADRGHIHEDIKYDFLARKNLFGTKGDEWKQLRAKLTPTFTSGRMKLMYQLMFKCSQRLDEYLENATINNECIDFKDLIARFTSDSISTCFFGLETNSVMEKDSIVRRIGKCVFSTKKWNMIKLMLSINQPRLYNLFKFEQFGEEARTFFMKVAKDTYEYRVKNDIYRDDFIDLLIKIKQNKNLFEIDKQGNKGGSRKSEGKDDGLTFEEMAAQLLVMFGAGFETSSSISTFALFELYRNPKALAKALEEIDQVLKNHNGKISYLALKEMSYLEHIIYETARLYPVLPILTRKCMKPYKLPDSDLVIEKGIRVIIPVAGINYDPEIYLNPLTFDPDRFCPERSHELPPVSLQFGDGPMTCLGMRFGKIQAKCALTTILSKFNLLTVPETPQKIILDPRQFFPTLADGVYFKVSKRFKDEELKN